MRKMRRKGVLKVVKVGKVLKVTAEKTFRTFITFTTLLAACGGSGGPTPLVLYSTHGRDQLTAMEKAFEAQNPDIDVRWLDMGSQDAFDRVRSERANPQGDVWFGGPSTLFLRSARDSLLVSYKPSWASG